MKIKKLAISTLLLFLLSCTNKKNTEMILSLEETNTRLENENQLLKRKFEQMDDSLFKPFQRFKRIVKSEYQTSPYLLLQEHDDFIMDYSWSYWAHEAKKRAKNIDDRSKYYDPYKGWNLPKEIKSEIIQQEGISCPGC